MRPKRRLLASVAVALAIAVVAVPAVQGQAIKNPDTFTEVRFGDPESLDYAYAYDTSSTDIILWNVYETLIFFDGGRTDRFIPMLATEVPSKANGGISADGKTYTFKIRQGVRFHDGSIMTPEDVKYSLLRFMFMDRDGGPSWILNAPILGTDVTRDDKGALNTALFDQADRAIQVKGNTVSVALKESFAPFLSIMAEWSMVTSKKWAIAQRDWDGTKAGLAKLNNPQEPEDTPLFTKANATGPFRVVRWDRAGRQVVLERHEGYWQGPAKLRRAVFMSVDDFAPRRLMLQQGDADFIIVGRPEQAQVQGLPGVRVIDDLSILTNDGGFMNTKIAVGGGNPDVGSGRLDGNGIPSDFFADINVRRGVAYAFDYASAVRDCNNGKASIGHGPIPAGLAGYNPNQKWYPTDRERATAAFREARGGQIWNTGFRFTVTFNTGNARRQCYAQIMKNSLEALNPKFRVDVRSITWAQYLQAYRDARLPLWFIGWAADYPDADNFVSPYMHSTGTYSHAQGYNNPQVDKLVEQARTETDANKRRDIYYQLQQIAFNDVTTIYIDRKDFRVMRTWVRGWYHNAAFPGEFFYLYRISKG